MSRLSRAKPILNAKDINRLRSGVNEVLEGYIPAEKVSLEDFDFSTMPPRNDDDRDLLTAPLVKALCEDMAENHVSAAIAGRAIGLPEKLLLSYVECGNDDLVNGRYTRLAWFAVMVNRAEGRVQKAIVQAILLNPLGWLNQAHVLDHLWPESFAVQRLNFKDKKKNTLDAELRKQFSEAVDAGGAGIPYIVVEDVGKIIEK